MQCYLILVIICTSLIKKWFELFFHVIIDQMIIMQCHFKWFVFFYCAVCLLLFCCGNPLYVMDTSPFSSISYANIYPSLWLAYWFFSIMYFDKLQFLLWCIEILHKKKILFLAFGVLSRKSLYTLRSWRYSPKFSSGHYIAFTFRSEINLKLILQYALK